MGDSFEDLRLKGLGPVLGGEPLFRRPPTNEEKRYYRSQWGGVPPLRVLLGMLFMLGLGLFSGYVVAVCPGTECQAEWIMETMR